MSNKRKWQQLSNEAWFAKKRGNFPEAESLLIAAVAEVNVDPQDRPDLCETLNTLANLYAENGELGKAVELAISTIEILRQLPQDSQILVGNGLMFLARVLTEAGQYAEAIPVAEEGVEIYSAVLGESHSEVVRMRRVLAEARLRFTQSS